MEINNEVLNKIINDPLRDKTLNCHEYTNGAVYDLATDLLSTRQKLAEATADVQMYKTASSRLARMNDELMEQLAEANEDAERLATKLQEYADADDMASLENGGCFTEPYKFIEDVMTLHRARVAKGGG